MLIDPEIAPEALLLGRAHVDHGPSFTDELVELAWVDDVAIAAQHVLGHVTEHVDPVPG